MGLLRVWMRSRVQHAGAKPRGMRETRRARPDGRGAWQYAHSQLSTTSAEFDGEIYFANLLSSDIQVSNDALPSIFGAEKINLDPALTTSCSGNQTYERQSQISSDFSA